MDYTETGPRRMVQVVEYDPSWPEKFAQDRKLLSRTLPDALAIEHIGSTSVPGLCAKPTLDILIVVSSIDSFLVHEPALADLGYEVRPGAFPEDAQHVFVRKMVDSCRTHHLHVLTQDSPRVEEYLLLRDYLRAHPSAVEEYAQLKLSLAVKYATDRNAYVEGKAGFVEDLNARAREWRTSISIGCITP